MNALLICNPTRSPWKARLLLALGEFINITALTVKASTDYIKSHDLDLIIVDKSGVQDVNELIRRLKSLRTNLPIIVAAEAPTWQEARSAFQAGADDVVSAAMSPEELRQILREIGSVSNQG